MAKQDASILPSPGPERRQAAAGQFDRANQVVGTGNYNYGIHLLLNCCQLDPGNLIYRQALRRTQKLKYKNNLRGSWLAWLTTAWPKAKMKKAKRDRDWLVVLELGEQVLTRNPWHIGTQCEMAEAADRLGLIDLSVWILEQARQKASKNLRVNRHLAALYEQRGNFKEAIKLWGIIRKTDPTDKEAIHKSKDLAVTETLARGHYQEAVSRDRDTSNEAKRKQRSDRAHEKKKKEAKEGTVQLGEETTPENEPASSHSMRMQSEEAGLRDKIRSDPTNPYNYMQLAKFFRRRGDFEAAGEVLREGLGPSGNNFELSVELADLDIEPFRQNLILTEERLRESTDDPELRKIRIRLLKEINTRELDIFRQKADRYPTDMSYRFEMGARLLRAGQTEEAIRELQTARSDASLKWRCSLYLGHCFRARQNWRMAKRNFEEANQGLPESEQEARKEVLYQLATGCAEAAETEEAIRWGEELANLDFGYRNIGTLLDEWQAEA